MGWAEKRIEEYRKGKSATWIERRILEHANPVHFPLAMIAQASLIYGLWTRNWIFIIVAVGLGFSGHLYCWMQK
mgnify:FL=1